MKKTKVNKPTKSKATHKVAEGSTKKLGKELVDIKDYTMSDMSSMEVDKDLNRHCANNKIKRGIGGFFTAVMFIAGIAGIAFGAKMCIDTMQMMGNAVKITDSEADQISRLEQEILELTELRDSLPEGDESMIQLVNTQTNVTVDAQDALSRLAGMNGLKINNIESYERKNESDILKAYYVYHGSGQVSGLLKFVEDVRESDMIVLVEEVYITEPMMININGEVSVSSNIDFRVTFQHSYSKGDLEAIGGDFQGQVGVEPPVETPEETPVQPSDSDDPECNHVYSEPGWSVAATHSTEGMKIMVCDICNEITELVVHTDDAEAHNWVGDSCIGASCEVCGAVSTDHLWGPWRVISSETCYSDGLKERVCIVEGCNIMESLTIPMGEHDPVQKDDGSWSCRDCGMTMTDPNSENITIG